MHLNYAQIESTKRKAGLFTGARVHDTQRAGGKCYRLLKQQAVAL